MKIKLNLGLSLFFILLFAICSCTKPKGLWDDNIHLSTKTAVFKAAGDSILIKTEGSSWEIDAICVDDKWYADFTSIDQIHNEKYSIKRDCVDLERRDKKTLFIKVKGSSISGGMVNLGEPWEIVFESGKWILYSLGLTHTPQGDINTKWSRQGTGTTLDIDVKTIENMAKWLEDQA